MYIYLRQMQGGKLVIKATCYFITLQFPFVKLIRFLPPPVLICEHVEESYFWHNCLESPYNAVWIALVQLMACCHLEMLVFLISSQAVRHTFFY